jgi:hypothetical protein
MNHTTNDRVLKPYGLYNHQHTDPDTGHARVITWRPDLVPVILTWLQGIPLLDLMYVAKLGASLEGAFLIEFDWPRRDAGADGGPRTRRIIIAFDHDMYAMSNGGPRVWTQDCIVPYDTTALYCAANIP